MAGKKPGGSKKKTIWSADEEELLISCWSENECLFKTSCADYKRQDKKSLACREAIIKALENEYSSTFTGKNSNYLCMFDSFAFYVIFIILSTFYLSVYLLFFPPKY
jgi:hypothetical protein